MAWNLRYPPNGVAGEGSGFFSDEPQGMMVAPGTYEVSLSIEVDGDISTVGSPQSFAVKPLRSGALTGAEPTEVADFWQQLSAVQHDVTVTNKQLSEAIKRLDTLASALQHSQAPHGDLDRQFHQLKTDLLQLDSELNGNRAKQEVGEKTKVTVSSRLGSVLLGTGLSTYGPTPTHQRSLEIAMAEYQKLKARIDEITQQRMPAFERALETAGAPYVH